MRTALLLAWLPLLACKTEPAPSGLSQDHPTVAGKAYLTQSLWDDGKAEIAFYQGWFTESDGARREFDVGTYLIKHRFDVKRQTKANEGGVPDFKWALFFEFEAGTEQFKYSYVANAAQKDLRPLKLSVNSFDWCSNWYRELSFDGSSHFRRLVRSDDYGNADERIELIPTSYPAASVPLLVRAIEFVGETRQRDFEVIQLDGSFVGAMADLVGPETVETKAGEMETEKIVVHYAKPIETIYGTRTKKEAFWRAKTPARHLVKMEGEDEKHGLLLVETLRSAYWQENIFPRLTRVKEHP